MEAQPSVWTGFGSSLAVSFASFGLVCFAAWLLFRWLAFRARGGAWRGGGLRLRAKLALEPRRAIYVVEVGSRAFLIGGGDAGLTLLAELAPEDVPVEGAVAAAEATAGAWWERLFASRRSGPGSGRATGWPETLPGGAETLPGGAETLPGGAETLPGDAQTLPTEAKNTFPTASKRGPAGDEGAL